MGRGGLFGLRAGLGNGPLFGLNGREMGMAAGRDGGGKPEGAGHEEDCAPELWTGMFDLQDQCDGTMARSELLT